MGDPIPVQVSDNASLRAAGLGMHVPALDGVRGLAICLVLMLHQTIYHVTENSSLIDRLFMPIASMGWMGVDLFFVLSGFLITGILLDSKSHPRYFQSFYARRSLRIFPLYYAVVFFSFVVLPHLHLSKQAHFERTAGSEIWYWVYLSNFSIAWHGKYLHPVMDVSWSLAIEEQFYLLWPLVVFLFNRRALVRICLGLVVAALVVRIIMEIHGYGEVRINVVTPARMDSLAMGALVALLARDGGLGRWRRSATLVGLTSVLAFAAIAVAGGYADVRNPWVRVAGYLFTSAAFSALIVHAAQAETNGWVRRFFENRVLRTFGKYSYALYLFHLPIRAAIRDRFFTPGRFPVILASYLPGQFIFYGVATAAALAAAWVSWQVYEKQFLKLKRFFPSPEPGGGNRAALPGRTNATP